MATMKIKNPRRFYKPLEQIDVSIEGEGILSVSDGNGAEYIRMETRPEISILLGGALGTQVLRFSSPHGELIETFRFKLDCETCIKDEKGEYSELLTMLYHTMRKFGEETSCYYNGKVYTYFVRWLRDHVHTLKGMKYFSGDLKSAIELYRDTQRGDGMIWDNVYPRLDKKPDYWEERFRYGDFIMASEDNTLEFKRIPVENDVEYLFVEGIYYTWKATGDDEWMSTMLDAAIKAYQYTLTSPYRWSEKYRLLKRGFTIDTWDYQSSVDAAITGDMMIVDKDKSHFGIMHGDNTGFAMACSYLAEMLEYCGRQEEAGKYRNLGREIKERLDKLAWNGRFYIHHVPEEEEVVRDLGVDQSKQLSLSNAYNLNRNLEPEKCSAIIESYLKIKENLPYGSSGEWYTIFPPFERGFNEKWSYMNGGVVSIVAGELSRGTFENGYEAYGADILRRVHHLAKKHDGYLPCCFKGAQPEKPKTQYMTVDISPCVNHSEIIPGWDGSAPKLFNELPEGCNSLEEVPFILPERHANGGNYCIHMGKGTNELLECSIPVGRKAASVYFLHALSGSGYAGSITLEFSDGEFFSKCITDGREIMNWWTPPARTGSKGRMPEAITAWEGRNAACNRVGITLYGLNNPFPEKEISRIVLEGAKSGVTWAVAGVTLSDQAVYFEPGDVSYGIPDNWGAAAVVYGLLEGLAGVTDQGVAFNRVRLSPRWSAADVNQSGVYVKYPASGGYAAYTYYYAPAEGRLTIEAAGSAEKVDFHVLLPSEKTGVISVYRNNSEQIPFTLCRSRQSTYVDFTSELEGATKFLIQLDFKQVKNGSDNIL